GRYEPTAIPYKRRLYVRGAVLRAERWRHAGSGRTKDRGDRRGHDGRGDRPSVRRGRVPGDDAGHRAASRRRRLTPDEGAARKARREGQDDPGRGRRHSDEDPRGRRPEGGRRGGAGRHRGGLREDGGEEGALRRARPPLPARGRVRLEYVVLEHHRDGERDEARGPGGGDALLQPRAGHEIGRGDPRLRDVG